MGILCPLSPGDLPNLGIEPRFPALQADSLPAEPQHYTYDNATFPICPTLCPQVCFLPLHLYSCPANRFSSVAQSCPTLCDPMNRSTPGLPVYHQLPEFTQTHVYQVRDAIQPSHPLSCPSPPAPNPSQHQSLFQ